MQKATDKHIVMCSVGCWGRVADPKMKSRYGNNGLVTVCIRSLEEHVDWPVLFTNFLQHRWNKKGKLNFYWIRLKHQPYFSSGASVSDHVRQCRAGLEFGQRARRSSHSTPQPQAALVWVELMRPRGLLRCQILRGVNGVWYIQLQSEDWLQAGLPILYQDTNAYPTQQESRLHQTSLQWDHPCMAVQSASGNLRHSPWWNCKFICVIN